MKEIHVCKAEPIITGQIVEPVAIVIDATIPSMVDDDWVREARRFHESEAEQIFRALKALPGGTFDSLLALMMTNRASLLSAPMFDTYFDAKETAQS